MSAGPAPPPPPPPGAPAGTGDRSSTRVRTIPYQGLAPYEDDDARWFFGRDRARQIVAANLLSERLTIVYGESGVGKSSLLRAGVAHHLRTEARRNLAELGTPEFVVVLVASWQDEPMATVERAMRDAVRELAGPSAALPDMVEGSLSESIKSWSRALDVDFLFIFDQFEECFLYHDDDDPFLRQLPDLVNRDDLRANFILALREDRLAQLDRLKSRLDTNLFANRLRVGHLDREAARDAILGPLALHNELHGTAVSMDDDLVKLVLDQVTRGRVSGLGAAGMTPEDGDHGHVETPFLQLVLTRLWETAVPATGFDQAVHTISIGTLQSLGGAEAIVRNHLDGAMAALSESERVVAADAFKFLVTPGGSKIALGADDLASFTDRSPDDLRAVLESLATGSMSILRTVEPPPGGTRRRYEIFHDVLAPAITEWRQRVEEQRTASERERQLTAQVGRWRRRVAVATVAALAIGAAAVIAVVTINNARVAADRERLLSSARAASDPQLALADALEATALSSTPEGMDLLRHVLSEPHPVAVVDDHDRTIWGAAFRPDGGQVVTASADTTALLLHPRTGEVQEVLEGHTDGLLGARYTPDGAHVVTWSRDGTARVWDATSGAQLHTLPHGSSAVFVQAADTASRDGPAVVSPFGDDGALLASSAGGVAWIWDLETGELVRTLPDLTAQASMPDLPAALLSDNLADLDLSGAIESRTAPVFTVDGTVLTGGEDGFARRFDVDTGEVVTRYGDGSRGWVTHAMADPTGQFVAVAHDGGWTSLHDFGSGEELVSWFSQADTPTGLAFTPSGEYLVTAGDTSVKAWRTDPPELSVTFDSSTDYVTSLTVAPDGRTVAATLTNGSVLVIDPGTGTVDQELVGHTNLVWTVDFAPDGHAVVTGGEDGTVRLWELPGGPAIDITADYLAPSTFGPDDTRLVVAGRDGVAWLLDAETGDELQAFVGDEPIDGEGVFPVLSAHMDPTGQRVVTVQSTGTILFDAVTGQRVGTCCPHEYGSEPWAAAFLPEPADHLLVAYADDTIGIWEVGADGETLVHTFDNAVTLATSTAGDVFVTQGRGRGATPGSIAVWDRDGTTFTRTAEWDTELLVSTAMSPDGNTVATVGFDGSVVVWDSDGERVFSITGQVATTADFSADGSRLAVGTTDGRITYWSATGGKFLGHVRAHPQAVGTISVAEDGRVASSGLEGSVRVTTCDLCDLTDEEVIELARERLLDHTRERLDDPQN